MRTTILSALTLGAAVFAAGCNTTAPLAQQAKPVQKGPQPVLVKPAPTPAVAAIGVPVQTLLDTAARDGLRTAFFTPEGKPSDVLPAAGGSISIFNATNSGQDNYTFAADGRVLKHMRSVGANYAQGIWEEVK